MNWYQALHKPKEQCEQQKKMDREVSNMYLNHNEQKAPTEKEVQFYDFEYYESGDIVFAVYDDHFWPSKVINPLNDYTLYEVMLFQLKIIINYSIEMLIEYNKENRQKCIDAFNVKQRSKRTKQKFYLAVKTADVYHRKMVRKQQQLKYEQRVMKHLEIEKEIAREKQETEQSLAYQNNKDEIVTNNNIVTAVHASTPQAETRQNIIISTTEASKENVPQISQSQKYIQSLEKTYQKQIKISSISSESNVSKSNNENKCKMKHQQRKQPTTIKNNSQNDTNVIFTAFRKKTEKLKDIAHQFIKPQRHSQEINEEEKNMVIFLSRYEYLFSQIDSHLQSLSGIEESVRVKICENAIDKIAKAISEPHDSKFKICNFFPLLKVIFSNPENQYISIDKIVNSNILARILLLIKAFEIMPMDKYKQEYELFTNYCRDVKQYYLIGDRCGIQVRGKIEELFKKFKFFC